MKVRCIRLFDVADNPLKESPWLKIGNVYHVLEITLAEKMLEFRLIGEDDATPALHRANQFELVSNYIPSSWVIEFTPNHFFSLTPASWTKVGFWEDYFNRVDEAVSLFELEKKRMIEEEP